MLASSLNDAIADVVIAKMQEKGKCPLGLPKQACNIGSKSAGLHKLLLDIAVWKWSDTAYGSELNDASHDFLVDLATALAKMRMEKT